MTRCCWVLVLIAELGWAAGPWRWIQCSQLINRIWEERGTILASKGHICLREERCGAVKYKLIKVGLQNIHYISSIFWLYFNEVNSDLVRNNNWTEQKQTKNAQEIWFLSLSPKINPFFHSLLLSRNHTLLQQSLEKYVKLWQEHWNSKLNVIFVPLLATINLNLVH